MDEREALRDLTERLDALEYMLNRLIRMLPDEALSEIYGHAEEPAHPVKSDYLFQIRNAVMEEMAMREDEESRALIARQTAP